MRSGTLVRWIAVGALTVMSAQAEPIKKEGVAVELVSERAAVTPGETTALAVVFRHEPGFHTYWRQPGIVGLATSLKWDLPPGLTAGDIVWPAPERTKMAHWGVWGFERDAALVVPITVSRDLDPNKTPAVTLSVRATWMACGETCHPGTATLTITLPVSEKTAPLTSSASLMARTRDEQAVESRKWKIVAKRRREAGGPEGFSLTVTAPPGRDVPKDAYFFGYARLVDSHWPQEHRLNGDGSVTIPLRLTESPDAIPAVLEGELHSATGWDAEGRKHLLRVKVPFEREARGPTRAVRISQRDKITQPGVADPSQR